MLPRLIFRWFDLNLSQGSNTLRKTIGRGQIQRRYICTCNLIMFIYDIIFRNYSNPNFFTEVKRQFCYLFTNSDGRIESVLRIGIHFFMFHSYLTQMSTFLHSKQAFSKKIERQPIKLLPYCCGYCKGCSILSMYFIQ